MRTFCRFFLLAASVVAASNAAAQPTPKPGTDMVPNEYGGTFPREITWGADGAEMVLIPHGSFVRGRDSSKGGSEAESPEATVTLHSYYIDKYEVSNQQYGKYAIERAGQKPRPSANADLKLPDHPAVAIPWSSAAGYAQWAGKQLPTEAMWEKAARGPKGSNYTTGNDIPKSGTLVISRGSFGTTVATTDKTGDVSGYGVHHMGGNAAEWVADYYSRDAYKAGETDNPKGPAKGETRVVRGAGFDASEGSASLRATYRSGYPPTQIRDELGFRTVWVPTDPKLIAQMTPVPTPEPTERVPTIDETAGKILERITPLIVANNPDLPKELIPSKAYLQGGTDELQFVNFTPYRVSLTFIGPDDQLVFKINEPLPPMTYRNVTLPKERDLRIVAYSSESPERKGPFFIGGARAESRAVIVVPTELFVPIADAEGKKIPLLESTELPQRYSELIPRWTEFEVLNKVKYPLVVKVLDTTRGTSTPDVAGEYTIEPNQAIRLEYQPGRYKFSAQYIGAMDECSTPKEFRIDDKAARRLLTLVEDKARPGSVAVITEKRPFVALELKEAKRLGFTKEEVSKKGVKPKRTPKE